MIVARIAQVSSTHPVMMKLAGIAEYVGLFPLITRSATTASRRGTKQTICANPACPRFAQPQFPERRSTFDSHAQRNAFRRTAVL